MAEKYGNYEMRVSGTENAQLGHEEEERVQGKISL